MDKPAAVPPASLPAKRVSAGEAWDKICRKMGYDPATLPDAKSLPPWTEEEAAAFEQAINETCEQIEEFRDTRL